MEIEYSDGAQVESRILDLVRQASDLGSTAAPGMAHYADWPVEYHLSPERGNLVRHLDFSGLSVLELGAGMGAVSRCIAESAKALHVIEGTKARYDVLAERLRDRSNWTGTVANLQDAPVDRTFDVVCVVGVLEYAELYVRPEDGKSPFAAFLDRARRWLKKDGALVLAIENKLGLKYWNGAAEDHTGRLFDGVCGYSLGQSPKTFSRRELLDLLAEAGLPHVEEHFPFPDYKVPATVLSRALVEHAPSLAAALAVSRRFRNYGLPRVSYFPEVLAARNVALAGLLPDFANSFLFIASRSADGATFKKLLRRQLEDGETAWHYASYRKAPTVTTFFAEGPAGNVLVKKALVGAAPEKAKNGWLTWAAPEPVRVETGLPLRHVFASRAYFDGPDRCLATLTDFLSWSLAEWKKSEALDGAALDAILTNAVVAADGSYRLYDLEWKLSEPMPKSWFVFRNVASLAPDADVFPGAAPFTSLAELYVHLCEAVGVTPDLAADLDREAALQAEVTKNADAASHRALLAELMRRPAGGGRFPRSPIPREESIRDALKTLPRKVLKKGVRKVLSVLPLTRSPA